MTSIMITLRLMVTSSLLRSVRLYELGRLRSKPPRSTLLHLRSAGLRRHPNLERERREDSDMSAEHLRAGLRAFPHIRHGLFALP